MNWKMIALSLLFSSTYFKIGLFLLFLLIFYLVQYAGPCFLNSPLLHHCYNCDYKVFLPKAVMQPQ